MGVQDALSLDTIEAARTATPDALVVLHFWASWCEPCKHMDTVLEQLSKDFPTTAFLRVEAEAVDDATIKFEVATVPTFVCLKGTTVVSTLEGADPPALTEQVTALHKQQPQPAAPGSAPPSAAQGLGSTPSSAAAAGSPGQVEGRIKFLLQQHPVLLFMKGVPTAPRCGFSRKVVDALQQLQVPFHAVDILEDEALRAGVKAFSDWPTFPQLYVQGELLGGCDIVLEMKASGELAQQLQEKLGPNYASAAAPAASIPTAPAPQHAPSPAAAPAAGTPSPVASEERLRQLVSQQPVMLFMKGNTEEPRCGFSRKVVEALQAIQVPFGTFDILADEAVRTGLKAFSNWPTFPQLYVKGELLGGCDIVLEMKASGDLKPTIDEMLGKMDVAAA